MIKTRENYKKAQNRYYEEEGKLAQHYYDCIDDYSWGGLCSNANSIAFDNSERIIKNTLEEALNGFVVFTDTIAYLKDLEGNIVSKRIVCTRYGLCWVTEDGQFVSVPKRESTLTKKGFKSAIVEREYHCTIKGYSAKSNPLFGTCEIARETETNDLGMVHYGSGSAYITYWYESH